MSFSICYPTSSMSNAYIGLVLILIFLISKIISKLDCISLPLFFKRLSLIKACVYIGVYIVYFVRVR